MMLSSRECSLHDDGLCSQAHARVVHGNVGPMPFPGWLQPGSRQRTGWLWVEDEGVHALSSIIREMVVATSTGDNTIQQTKRDKKSPTLIAFVSNAFCCMLYVLDVSKNQFSPIWTHNGSRAVNT